MGKQKKLRSMIKQYISDECYFDLYRCTLLDTDNNGRIFEAKRVLQRHGVPFDGLGSGTNRFAVMIDQYAVKIAVDDDGMIDNRREFKYSQELYPYVTKSYECIPNGLILVSEYVNVFEESTFRAKKEEMKEILSIISRRYLIGDVGYNPKNYINWGSRPDGTICILDFAYIYDLSFKVFTCDCNGISMVKYDENFVNLRCPACGRKYTFGDIRMKITKKQQEKEIGDIRTIGYNLTKPEEIVDEIEEFKPVDMSSEKIKSVETPAERIIRESDERDERLRDLEESQGYPLNPDELNDAEIEVYRAAGIL